VALADVLLNLYQTNPGDLATSGHSLNTAETLRALPASEHIPMFSA